MAAVDGRISLEQFMHVFQVASGIISSIEHVQLPSKCVNFTGTDPALVGEKFGGFAHGLYGVVSIWFFSVGVWFPFFLSLQVCMALSAVNAAASGAASKITSFMVWISSPLKNNTDMINAL